MRASNDIPPPHPGERLLSGGKESGPRVDRLWARLDAQLDAQDAAARKPASKAWWWLLPVLVPAALVLMVWRVEPGSTVMERGTQEPTPPTLQSSCGTSQEPCLVGQPIYLRLMPHTGTGVVYVVLRGESTRLLAGPIESRAEVVPLPIKITPDETDVDHGLLVEAYWFASEKSADDMREWVKQPTGLHGRLVMVVKR